jgi:hypothetical protein
MICSLFYEATYSTDNCKQIALRYVSKLFEVLFVYFLEGIMQHFLRKILKFLIILPIGLDEF